MKATNKEQSSLLIWSNFEYEDLTELEDAEDRLDDERMNLDIPIKEEIICIAKLGLWDGTAYAMRTVGNNIKSCLYSDVDYTTWYVDQLGDLRCKAVHHDGTNHYLYRAWKPGVSETQKENFFEKLRSGKLTRRDITRLTQRLGDYIGKVYGWTFR